MLIAQCTALTIANPDGDMSAVEGLKALKFSMNT